MGNKCANGGGGGHRADTATTAVRATTAVTAAREATTRPVATATRPVTAYGALRSAVTTAGRYGDRRPSGYPGSHGGSAGRPGDTPGNPGSPGVGSGNDVEAPVDAPVNVCGNTVNVGGSATRWGRRLRRTPRWPRGRTPPGGAGGTDTPGRWRRDHASRRRAARHPGKPRQAQAPGRRAAPPSGVTPFRAHAGPREAGGSRPPQPPGGGPPPRPAAPRSHLAHTGVTRRAAR